MSFIADFTVTQSNDGSILTFTDVSNYVSPGTGKADFTSRTLYLTFADGNPAIAVPFPYTNTNNAIQDIVTYTIDRDRAFVAKLELTQVAPDPTSILFQEAAICTTEYVEKGLRKLLSNLDLCDCKADRLFNDIALVEIGKIAALNRADRGDIAQAQKDISFVQDKVTLLLG